MKAYSLDLRERIVGFVKQGGSKAEATRRFGVSKWTVYRYVEADRGGCLAPRPCGGRQKKFEDDTLRGEVKARPSAKLKEYGESLGVSHVAVWRRLRRLAITLKKKQLLYAERDGLDRWFFQRELAELTARGRTVYFLDESGIDHRLDHPYARAPRGERVHAEVHGSRRGRTSVISASRHGRLVCPFTFEGHCNREVVETYFKEMLLPSVPRGSVIVLDNASFHRSPALQSLVEAAGCTLMFLPVYSPDLNPIEHIWAALKRMLRGGLQGAEDKIAFIGKGCLSLCA